MVSGRLMGAIAAASLGLASGALLGGCGSQTKTVSVGGEPSGASAATAQQTTSAATTATTTAPAAGTPATGGTSAPATTRTATEPAFTEGAGSSGGAAAAAAVVRGHGYTPNDTAEYHPDQTLQVLVGTRTGSGDGYDQRAFFFLDGHYLGTDARDPSASVKVLSQSDTEVTLGYTLYRHADPLCCPGGGVAKVRFQLDNGRLAAIDPIPPVSSTSALARD
jgi:hypothetical protein